MQKNILSFVFLATVSQIACAEDFDICEYTEEFAQNVLTNRQEGKSLKEQQRIAQPVIREFERLANQSSHPELSWERLSTRIVKKTLADAYQYKIYPKVEISKNLDAIIQFSEKQRKQCEIQVTSHEEKIKRTRKQLIARQRHLEKQLAQRNSSPNAVVSVQKQNVGNGYSIACRYSYGLVTVKKEPAASIICAMGGRKNVAKCKPSFEWSFDDAVKAVCQ